jgi:hypothetical protein
MVTFWYDKTWCPTWWYNTKIKRKNGVNKILYKEINCTDPSPSVRIPCSLPVRMFLCLFYFTFCEFWERTSIRRIVNQGILTEGEEGSVQLTSSLSSLVYLKRLQKEKSRLVEGGQLYWAFPSVSIPCVNYQHYAQHVLLPWATVASFAGDVAIPKK